MYNEIDNLILLVLKLYEKRIVNGDTPEVSNLAEEMASFASRHSLEDEIRDVLRNHLPTRSSQRMTVHDANRIIQYLLSLRSRCTFETVGVPPLFHPSIVRVASPRFNAGQYADAVESAFKELNNAVKKTVQGQLEIELDGPKLMQRVFSPEKPILLLVEDLDTMTNRDTQQGYMMMFSGAMSAIRNPKAHENMTITREDALRKLYFASMLMFKLDAAKLTSSRTSTLPRSERTPS